MASVRQLNRSGDTAVTWEPANLASADADLRASAAAAVAEATALIAATQAANGLVVTVDRTSKVATPVRGPFDPAIEQDYLLTPQLVGG